MSITASEARRNLFPLIEEVNEDRTVVEIVSRRGNAVLMSADDYAALVETACLLRSPENARRLLGAYLDAQGWEDFSYWASNDRAMTKPTIRLITDVLRDPFSGIGKPEPVQHAMPGAWSRRISDEHRLVYLVTDKEIVILQARYHY